jgi:hypothetical protein
MGQRYYTRWRIATHEQLDPALLELLPPLAKLCPPATTINTTRYSPFAVLGYCNTCKAEKLTASL